MYNDQEKQKVPYEQKKQPLTDEEAKQASGGVSAPVAPSSRSGGGVYAPNTPSFKMDAGVINEEKQESGGGVSVPNTSSFRMDGGTP